MTLKFSTMTGQRNRLLSATIATLLVLAVVSTGFLFVGTAAAEDNGDEEDEWDEIINSTIETTENTSYVEYDIVFAEEMINTDEETVELTIYEEADWNDSEIDETAVLEETVVGSPNETVTHEYTVGTEEEDDLEGETEYRVLVETENEDNVVSVYVEPDDEAIGGVSFDSGLADTVPGFGLGVAVAAVAIALAGLARFRGGGRVE